MSEESTAREREAEAHAWGNSQVQLGHEGDHEQQGCKGQKLAPARAREGAGQAAAAGPPATTPAAQAG
eukprot:1111262-Heterocapsa_arctica.AAC.1